MSSSYNIDIPKLGFNEYFGILFTALGIYTIWLVFHYAEPGFPWHSYITTIVGYFASFGLLIVVPIDIATSITFRKSSSYDVCDYYDTYNNQLVSLYRVLFLIIFIMGNFVLSLEEYYNTDGYFTVLGRLASSLYRFLYDIIIMIVAALILLGILIKQKVLKDDITALEFVAIIVTNTLYETFLVVLIAIGLTELPRSFWFLGNLDYSLLRYQMKAASAFANLRESELSISLAVSDVLKTKEDSMIKKLDGNINNALTVLLQECPSEFTSSRIGKVAADKNGKVTIHTLAALRLRLNQSKDAYRVAQVQVDHVKTAAYFFEDLVDARKQNEHLPADHRKIKWTISDKESSNFQYNWYIFYEPIVWRIVAVLLAILSLLSFLGSIGSYKTAKINTLPYFEAVHHRSATPAGIVIFIAVTLGYATYSAFWSLNQFRFAGSMVLVPHRTKAESLSFNVRMMQRLAAPLAFFYLSWIDEAGLRTEDLSFMDNAYWSQGGPGYNATIASLSVDDNQQFGCVQSMKSAFSVFYRIDSVKFVQNAYGIFFPTLLIVMIVLHTTNLFNRILVYFKCDNYQFGTSIVTEEQLREGRRQLERFKQSTIRAVNRTKNLSKGQLQGQGGLLANLWGKQKEEDIESGPKHVSEGNSHTVKAVVIPEILIGSAEQKVDSAFLGIKIGSPWAAVTLEIRPPGTLNIRDSSQKNELVELHSIVDFISSTKANKANGYLNLELPDSTVRFRFQSVKEAEQWKLRLMEWKDYYIDNLLVHRVNNPADRVPASLAVNSNPLNRVSHDEDSQPEDDGPLMQGKKSSSSTPAKTVDRTSLASVTLNDNQEFDEKPASIQGYLMTKAEGQFNMGWQKKYYKINEFNNMSFYKSDSNVNSPLGTIDLKLVGEITMFEKKSGNEKIWRIDVELEDGKKLKLRADDKVTCQRWVSAIEAWRDYFLLQLH